VLAAYVSQSRLRLAHQLPRIRGKILRNQPTSGANSPDPAQDSQASDSKRLPWYRAAFYRGELPSKVRLLPPVPKTGYSQETHSARGFPAGLPSPSLVKRVGWMLFAWSAGRFIALTVCRLMNHNLEKTRGLPTLISQNGVVKLWRIERFAEISCSPAEQWVLDDGAPAVTLRFRLTDVPTATILKSC